MRAAHDRPFKTTIEARKPKSKAHLNFADVRRAVAVVTGFDGKLQEDVQVWEWQSLPDKWVFVYDLKKGDTPPWKQ